MGCRGNGAFHKALSPFSVAGGPTYLEPPATGIHRCPPHCQTNLGYSVKTSHISLTFLRTCPYRNRKCRSTLMFPFTISPGGIHTPCSTPSHFPPSPSSGACLCDLGLRSLRVAMASLTASSKEEEEDSSTPIPYDSACNVVCQVMFIVKLLVLQTAAPAAARKVSDGRSGGALLSSSWILRPMGSPRMVGSPVRSGD